MLAPQPLVARGTTVQLPAQLGCSPGQRENRVTKLQPAVEAALVNVADHPHEVRRANWPHVDAADPVRSVQGFVLGKMLRHTLPQARAGRHGQKAVVVEATVE